MELDALRLLESLLSLLLWLSEAGLLAYLLADLLTWLFTDLLTDLYLFAELGLLRLALTLKERLGTTDALFFVDADLFLDLSVAAGRGFDGGGGEGCVGLFVTFPSV